MSAADTSDYMVDLESTTKSGGDLTKNTTRVFAWIVAGIVASIIISIIMMLIGFVVGFSVDRNGLNFNGSMVPVALSMFLAVGVGFATAGAIYESFVGCS